MGTQYGDKPKHPGETLIYEMEYVPGDSIAVGDSLTGDPTAKITRVADGVDVTSDVVGPPVIEGMLSGPASRVGNSIFVAIKKGTPGMQYMSTTYCDTVNGEIDVEEHLIIEVEEL
jgi:hypothetical protein